MLLDVTVLSVTMTDVADCAISPRSERMVKSGPQHQEQAFLQNVDGAAGSFSCCAFELEVSLMFHTGWISLEEEDDEAYEDGRRTDFSERIASPSPSSSPIHCHTM